MDPIALLPKSFRRRLSAYLKRRGIHTVFNRELVERIWIDVGAHLGQGTLDAALNDPRLLVFAFEPNWELARQVMGRAANFVVLPMAVSDQDGFANFFINTEDGSSSLLSISESVVEEWKGKLDLTVKGEISTQTIRLDTFLHVADIPQVDFLKVDAEGADLRVIQSAGQRLKDIREIKAEVEVGEKLSFVGAPTRSEMIEFMERNGFKMTAVEEQNQGRQQNLTFVQAT